MICVGIDDTDIAGSPGTNQLARAIVAEMADCCRCVRIVRHQLLADPRVPCTSKNGCASIALEPLRPVSVEEIAARSRQRMRAWYVEGSDPGLCVAEDVAPEVMEFGRRCQTEYVSQAQARGVAAAAALYLEGLGGTEDGVIGALAAVGLAATGDDGRVVQLGQWPDDLTGVQRVALLRARGLEVREYATNRWIEDGCVDVGKHLRPNRRQGRDVLWVERLWPSGNQSLYAALRFP